MKYTITPTYRFSLYMYIWKKISVGGGGGGGGGGVVYFTVMFDQARGGRAAGNGLTTTVARVPGGGGGCLAGFHTNPYNSIGNGLLPYKV